MGGDSKQKSMKKQEILTILVSNEKGNVFKQDVFRNLDPPIRTPEDISLHSLKEQELYFKLIANEEESN